MGNNNFYNFSHTKLNGESIDFSQFKGKVVLVVNTASKCGFTKQFEGLEKLYKKYKSSDFVILGFPCNQFMNQEPNDESGIENGCVLNYGVTFPMFKKVDVNGKDAHPLFVYLKNSLPGFVTNSIKWNFTKFLVNKDGVPVKRFGSLTKPEAIESEILKLLK